MPITHLGVANQTVCKVSHLLVEATSQDISVADCPECLWTALDQVVMQMAGLQRRIRVVEKEMRVTVMPARQRK